MEFGIRQLQETGIEVLERPGKGGPSLVLLHGIGSNADSFSALLKRLPEDCRVIAWNAPGYGRSRTLEQHWPLASDYAMQLAGLYDELQLDDTVLFGHSLGALMAAAFAVMDQTRIARMVLASPALGHGVVRGEALSSAAQSRIDELEAMGPEAFAEARSPRLVHQPESNPQLVTAVYQGMSRVNPQGYAQAVRMLASGALLTDLARVSVPVDVLVGAEDVVTPPENARRAFEAVAPEQRGRFTTVTAAGHALYHQATAAVAAALEASMTTVR